MTEKPGKTEKPALAEEEKKAEKAEPQKRKREEKGIYTLYKIEADKVTRLRPTCERCGAGFFMAEHKDRYTCGHCGFTRYKTR